MSEKLPLGGIRILHLEDSPEDAELVKETLAGAGIAAGVLRVETRDEFLRQLAERNCDLILSDYNLPTFDGLSALALARERRPDIPFILVSGLIGDVQAVEVLKQGATDLVPKEHLPKLPHAVRRALEEARERARSMEAQGKLLESEERFRLVMKATTDTIFDVDVATRRVWWNENFYSTFAYSPKEIDYTGDWWGGRIHVEDRDRVLASVREAMEQRERRWVGEYRFLRGDGKYADVLVRGHILYDSNAQACRWVGSLMDVTQFKSLNQQFLQAQKMEAIGRLAGGVAHDFNNLLTVINGYSEILLLQLPSGAPMKPDLEEIQNAGLRAAGLTRQLLAFSRRQVTQPVSLDLNAILPGLEKMLVRLLGEDVKLTFVAGKDLRRVVADPGQIEQAIVNLVVNARDAMPRGGRITIETANVELDGEYVRHHAEATPGPHVMLAVSDTGTGMDPEVQAHLFEPFFTTKEKGKGTGLGLSTVHGIVKQSGGTIEVYSEVGRGTTFKIYLPKGVKGTAVRAGPATTAEGARGHETLLIAEDQESVRRLAAAILESSGYTVLQAKDGTEALKVCEDHPGEIHLLLTDLVMRSMTGGELAKLISRSHRETSILFMSGYTDRAVEDQGLLEGEASFIQKPFGVDDLKRKVREILDSGREKRSRRA